MHRLLDEAFRIPPPRFPRPLRFYTDDVQGDKPVPQAVVVCVLGTARIGCRTQPSRGEIGFRSSTKEGTGGDRHCGIFRRVVHPIPNEFVLDWLYSLSQGRAFGT